MPRPQGCVRQVRHARSQARLRPIPTYGSPIGDLELWQCAQQQLDQHGDEALYVAANRMAELIDDRPGYATWAGISLRIALLGKPLVQ